MKLSICLAYHNNPQMLERQFREWGRLPLWVATNMEVVICDDASDEPAQYDKFVQVPETRIFRIRPPHIRWSHRCATNIAAHHARGEWLLITDIDHVVPNETLQHLMGMVLDPDTVYTFWRRDARGEQIKAHPDSWYIHRDKWDRIGGWDERYRGYYGQNANIWRRVRHFAGEPVPLPLYLQVYGSEDVPDAETPSDKRGGRLEDKAAIHALARAFRAAGTFYDSHKLTAKYDGVPNPYA